MKKDNLRNQIYDAVYSVPIKDLEAREVGRIYDKVIDVLMKAGVNVDRQDFDKP